MARPGLHGTSCQKSSVNPGDRSCPNICTAPASEPSIFTSYQRTFDEFLERCKQLTNYRANVIANINNCLSFR